MPAFEDMKSQAELDKAVGPLDAALFDFYNRCDLEKFASFFAEDVEFYHDPGRRHPRPSDVDRHHEEEYLRQSDT